MGAFKTAKKSATLGWLGFTAGAFALLGVFFSSGQGRLRLSNQPGCLSANWRRKSVNLR